MAGKGTRLRPHTLITPKPLFKIAGKTIVERLILNLQTMFVQEKITDIGFVIGDFGAETEKNLLLLAENIGAKGHIFQQKQALGTADAVACAAELLKGKVVVAFADTLFTSTQRIDANSSSTLFVKSIEDPSAFGVIKMNAAGQIIDFIEKPKDAVSNLAMIGIYYFAEANLLKKALSTVMDQKIMRSGEYQLPDALRLMMEEGVVFEPTSVDQWLDCGNKTAVLEAYHFILQEELNFLHPSAVVKNTVLISPYYVAANAQIEHAIIGPFTSIETGAVVKNSQLSETIFGDNSYIEQGFLTQSIVGKNSRIKGKNKSISLGDYSDAEI